MLGPNNGPHPELKHPIPMHKRVGFLKPLVTAENIEIGDFTYYDDPDGPDLFQTKCVLHHYPFIGDKLIIGKFCAIAEGARFIMNGANHAMSGFSTYPFNIFGHGWEEGFDQRDLAARDTRRHRARQRCLDRHGGRHPARRENRPRRDRWRPNPWSPHDVPPFAIVAGNPAKIVKMRFDQRTVDRLLAVAWWDWPVDKITRNLNAIRGADIKALEAAA